MKRLLSIPAFFLFGAFLISSNCYSQEKIFENYWAEVLPFNFFTGCEGGEIILNLQGEEHRVIQTMIKTNGSVQYITNRNMNLTGIGKDTGAKYKWIVNRHRTWIMYPDSYPYSFYNNYRVRLIGQGDAPDLFWYITEKTTIDKDGVTKVDVIETTYDCQ